jgi:hypothetical protein
LSDAVGPDVGMRSVRPVATASLSKSKTCAA